MYVSPNFRTKKELKEAVTKGERITVFQPNAMFPINTNNGTFAVEGPHYPKPHTWYANVTVKDGTVISVK